jgi:hypothetical protein
MRMGAFVLERVLCCGMCRSGKLGTTVNPIFDHSEKVLHGSAARMHSAPTRLPLLNSRTVHSPTAPRTCHALTRTAGQRLSQQPGHLQRLELGQEQAAGPQRGAGAAQRSHLHPNACSAAQTHVQAGPACSMQPAAPEPASTGSLRPHVQVVEQEFDELFPGQVVAVQPVYDVRELEPLDKEYDKLSRKLWDLVGDYSHKLRDDKKIKKRKQVGPRGVRFQCHGVVSGRAGRVVWLLSSVNHEGGFV